MQEPDSFSQRLIGFLQALVALFKLMDPRPQPSQLSLCLFSGTRCGQRGAIRRGNRHIPTFPRNQTPVQITVEQDLPEQTAVLLSVIGGFLALRELQAEIDASAAVGGIVAASAG